ncbi:DUF2470 domain-containing protein [Nakamurella silvestris]|nr:DUF2470 domain-containing protein [Nakamurella silvestris]
MTWLTPEVIGAIKKHMNSDHVGDNLLIVRALGEAPTATSAELTDLDLTAAEFTVTVDGQPVVVQIPWQQPLADRAQIRAEVVRMYHEACDRLGVAPRTEEQH